MHFALCTFVCVPVICGPDRWAVREVQSGERVTVGHSPTRRAQNAGLAFNAEATSPCMKYANGLPEQMFYKPSRPRLGACVVAKLPRASLRKGWVSPRSPSAHTSCIHRVPGWRLAGRASTTRQTCYLIRRRRKWSPWILALRPYPREDSHDPAGSLRPSQQQRLSALSKCMWSTSHTTKSLNCRVKSRRTRRSHPGRRIRNAA